MSDKDKTPPAPPAALAVKRLKAPFGLLIHPGDETRFTPTTSRKHEMDNWTQIQFDAGKLVETDD